MVPSDDNDEAAHRRLEWTTDRETLRDSLESSDQDLAFLFVPLEVPCWVGDRLELHLQVGRSEVYVVRGIVDEVHAKGAGQARTGVTMEVDLANRPSLIRALSEAGASAAPWAKRRYPRIRTQLETRLAFSALQVAARVVDLSKGGARLKLDGQMPTKGELVSLVITMDIGADLVVDGTVRWLDYLSGSKAIGVEFNGGDPGWERQVQQLIEDDGDA